MTLIAKKTRLEDVQKSFRNWRIERPERGCRHLIPENLWKDAISLFAEHTPAQICKALQLDLATFNERVPQGRKGKAKAIDQASLKLVANHSSPTFTVVKVGDLMTTPNDKWSASIKRPDGYVLSVSGCGATDLNNLVSQFCSEGS